MTSWASSLIGRIVVRLLHARNPRRERQEVQGIVGAPLATDLEVQMVGRRAAGPADRRDRLAGRDPVARLDEVRIVVGVDREEAAVVRDLDDATVAGLDAAHPDDAGCRRLHGRAGLGLDVDAGVPAAAPPAEAGGPGGLEWPDEHPAELVRVGPSELAVLRDARARRPRRGPRAGRVARLVFVPG